MTQNHLIFDVGANNGDDTAFYLAKGFRVVAIEANPELCDAMIERFTQEVDDGRLVVENVGISDVSETLTFYSNEFSEWSSFVRVGKATKRFSHSEILVETEPLSAMLKRRGTPYYLKIDIEGFERRALSTLDRQYAPQYLSFELNPDWEDILTILTALDYCEFKLVRQGKGFLPAPPLEPLEGTYVSADFTDSMSGLFGRELPGEWLDLPQIKGAIERVEQQSQENVARGLPDGWHDIHCKLCG